MTPNDLVAITDNIKSFNQDFILSSILWAAHSSTHIYSWKRVRFKKSNSKAIPDKPGIYCFVIRPEVASLDEIGYLMYIGEAGASSKNTLRKRFNSYFSEKARLKRPYITYLLNKWQDHLHFYHCAVDPTQATSLLALESELIGTFIPPYNVNDFPVNIAAPVKAFR
jgi:hypothetical protein